MSKTKSPIKKDKGSVYFEMNKTKSRLKR